MPVILLRRDSTIHNRRLPGPGGRPVPVRRPVPAALVALVLTAEGATHRRPQPACCHRTLASEDREYNLLHQQGGTYQLDTALPSGNWHIRISSDDVGWRLAGPTQISADGSVQIGAGH